MNTSINFPNLGIHLSNVGKSISIGGFEIAYYGMIIACGMILGLCIAMWVAKKTNQNPDQYFDVALYAIPIALIGARAYYVIFSWDQYKDNLIHILYFREGGLAIFGGVIAAVITFYVYVKIKKQNFWLMADTACVGLVLGQIIGRWGNFFNREAFGGYTNGLFAMQLPLNAVRSSDVTQEMMEHLQTIDGVQYIQVHPTFYTKVFGMSVFCCCCCSLQSIRNFTARFFTLSRRLRNRKILDRGAPYRSASASGDQTSGIAGAFRSSSHCLHRSNIDPTKKMHGKKTCKSTERLRDVR